MTSRIKETTVAMVWLAVTAISLYLLVPAIRSAWYALQDIPIAAHPPLNHAQKPIVRWDRARALEGYTLVTWQHRSTVMLVDMQGREVHRWTLPMDAIMRGDLTRKGRQMQLETHDAVVYPNGDLLVQLMLSGGTPYGYALARLDKDSKLLWTYGGNAHHDISLDPASGHIEILTHDFISPPPGLQGTEPKLLNDYVITLSDSGEVLDTLSVVDTFMGTPFQYMIEAPSNRKLWDILHTNSIMRLSAKLQPAFPQFKTGSLLLSLRNKHIVAVVDPDTHKVIWARNSPWRMQHSAHFLKNGNILLFDNLGKDGGEKSPARIIETNLDGVILWEYPKQGQPVLYNHSYGRLQVLANGNRLVVQSHDSRVFEVTRAGEIVWEYKTRKKGLLIMSATRYRTGELPFLDTP